MCNEMIIVYQSYHPLILYAFKSTWSAYYRAVLFFVVRSPASVKRLRTQHTQKRRRDAYD